MATQTTDRPTTRAQVRYLRMSASKVRVVLDLIRGKKVDEALQILAFSERLAAKDITKVLRAAVANAEHNDGQAADELVVAACYADEGPTLKRFRPKSRGRAGRIDKRTCHITIEVARMTDEQLEAARRKADRAGRPATGDAAAARRRRVARSRGEQAPAGEGGGEQASVAQADAEEAATQVTGTATEEAAAPETVTDVTAGEEPTTDPATDDAVPATDDVAPTDEREDS
jgi:large subunit ribosomal protein L22